jgi:hypothetical protein
VLEKVKKKSLCLNVRVAKRATYTGLQFLISVIRPQHNFALTNNLFCIKAKKGLRHFIYKSEVKHLKTNFFSKKRGSLT